MSIIFVLLFASNNRSTRISSLCQRPVVLMGTRWIPDLHQGTSGKVILFTGGHGTERHHVLRLVDGNIGGCSTVILVLLSHSLHFTPECLHWFFSRFFKVTIHNTWNGQSGVSCLLSIYNKHYTFLLLAIISQLQKFTRVDDWRHEVLHSRWEGFN